MKLEQIRRLTFVIEELEPHTSAQQLLDRFLIGYPREGEFHKPKLSEVCVVGADANAPLPAARVRDFGLRLMNDLAEAIPSSDAVVVVRRGSGAVAGQPSIDTVLGLMRSGARCFVCGTLANGVEAAQSAVALARKRGVLLSAGSATSVTFRLPQVELPRGTRLQNALIAVQGAAPDGEFEALSGLLPLLERRAGGESGIQNVQLLEGPDVWKAGDEGKWSRPLLASALSRSNTIQGDPVRDGRTQEIVLSRRVESLAKQPRAWLLDHRDGLRSALLILDGAATDFNFAIESAGGKVISAQLYRPPAPMMDHFSLLTSVMERFFLSGEAPWSIDRSILISRLLEMFADHRGSDLTARASVVPTAAQEEASRPLSV